ncbi:MAG: hypothetical protein JNJ83_13965 [Verrucomicrobiaceae bacterium]|nr:hypothetical protein [Verrucomicrobiaceae bacterium]
MFQLGKKRLGRALLTALCGCFCLAVGGCKSLREKSPEEVIAEAEKKAAQDPKAAKPEEEAALNVDFLLDMAFNEAAAITNAQNYVPGVARVAADSVEVVKRGADGNPRRVRASGHVFLEMTGLDEVATALSQEAYITEDEIILRGRPVVKRGFATLEGLSDSTVFFVLGNQIRALGSHRVKNGPVMPRDPEQSAAVMATLQEQKKTGLPGVKPGQIPYTSLPEVGPWREGPNPLLPPLDDTAVPPEVREEMRRQMEAEAVLQNARRSGD